MPSCQPEKVQSASFSVRAQKKSCQISRLQKSSSQRTPNFESFPKAGADGQNKKNNSRVTNSFTGPSLEAASLTNIRTCCSRHGVTRK